MLTATAADLRSLLRKQGLVPNVSAFESSHAKPAPTGLAALDALLGGGLPRGEISECFGGLSSGCTTVALSTLAQATAQGELAAYVDAADGLDPNSAERAGVSLDSLLWVRCAGHHKGKLERHAGRTSRSAQAWKAAHLIASAGGFGLVVLDLLGLSLPELRGLQCSPWFGLRKAIVHSPTAILTLSSQHVTGSVGALALSFTRDKARWRGSSGISLRLAGLSMRVRMQHQRRSLRGQADACHLEAER